MDKTGTLLPLFSLPGAYGIGTMGKSAIAFLDYLKKTKQQVWQILPIGTVDAYNSPYQSLSAYAGNPWLIDPDVLGEKGLLSTRDLTEAREYFSARACVGVDYDGLRETRSSLLYKAYRVWVDKTYLDGHADETEAARYDAWLNQNRDYVEDYAEFTALNVMYDGRPWAEWDEFAKTRKGDRYASFLDTTAEERNFYIWQQYEFDIEFAVVKEEAHRRGVRILGDMPIYVSLQSADVWRAPENFLLQPDGTPLAVAGVPPDYFSATGQVWGSPLYNVAYQKEHGYAWWVSRFRRVFALYDDVRIDHFRAFAAFYSIPYGDTDACRGHWEKGAGVELFDRVKSELGELSVFAEDLGIIDQPVRDLLAETGFPGMKVLQFAFSGDKNNEYLPTQHVKNCVVYSGTHDNNTTRGFVEALSVQARAVVEDVLEDNLTRLVQERDLVDIESVFPTLTHAWEAARLQGVTEKDIDLFKKILSAAASSVARLVIFTMQDELFLEASSRINTPATVAHNWLWRLSAIPKI